MKKKFLLGAAAVLAAVLAGCGGAPTGQVELQPVFNTGGQDLLVARPAGDDGVVAGPYESGLVWLDLTVQANKAGLATVRLTRDTDGVTATVTADSAPTLTDHVRFAPNVVLDWLGIDQNQVSLVQARGRGQYLTASSTGMEIRLDLTKGEQDRVEIPVPVAPTGVVVPITSVMLEGWNDPLNGGWSTTGAFDFYGGRAHLRLRLEVAGTRDILVRMLFDESTGQVYSEVQPPSGAPTISNRLKFGSRGWRPAWLNCLVNVDGGLVSRGGSSPIALIDGGLELRLIGATPGQHTVTFSPITVWDPVE